MKRNKVIAIPENQFRLYLPKLYEELNSWDFPDNFTWLQKMYHFGNGDKNLELGLCKECGRRCVFIDYYFRYEEYCCGDFCINDIKTKEDIHLVFEKNLHKIFHYFNEFMLKHKPILEKILELNNNNPINEIISSPRNLFLFSKSDIEHTCKVCGKETEFYGWSGKKWLNERIYFKRTCCEECRNKYRSILQIGENNTYHKMTQETRMQAIEKTKNSMKKLIQEGKFTPNITNSWCHSKFILNYKDKSGNIKSISLRSSFEVLFFLQNKDKNLEYEKLRIQYKTQDNKNRTYITDFVDYENKVVYEIKPLSKTNTEINVIKMNCLKEWCSNNGFSCKYITEVDLLNNMKSFSLDDLIYMDDEYKRKFLLSLKRYKFIK